MLYIYIYIYTQNSLFGGSVLERFLERFWKGFGEVFETILDITFTSFHMTLHIVLEGN